MASKLINLIKEKYKVSYVGLYDIPGRDHVYVFYAKDPDRSKGHSNYLGVIWTPNGEVYLTNAVKIVEAEYNAIEVGEGEFIVSRYRHDYQSRGDAMIDGGLDYARYNPAYPITHKMRVVDGKEVFERL